MATAVVSRFTDADDEITLAQERQPLRDIPDYERQLEFLARERAIWCWGRLRALSVFDSAQAEQIITEAILEAVAASKKPADDRERLFDQVRTVARRLKGCVLRLWGENTQRDPSKGPVKECRICGGSKNLHDKGCVVGKALALASQVPLGED